MKSAEKTTINIHGQLLCQGKYILALYNLTWRKEVYLQYKLYKKTALADSSE